MPGLVPGIHVFLCCDAKDVDGRDVWREDARSLSSGAHWRDPLALLPGHDGKKGAPGNFLIFRNCS
jgi:hypothetical protein